MKIVAKILFSVLCLGLLFSACSKSNNLLLGRVEAMVGSHKVIVTDCYKTSVPKPQKLDPTPDGKLSYRFMPCRDADVVIRGEELSVNGISYGRLKDGDTITVDHGKVLVNDRAALVTGESRAD